MLNRKDLTSQALVFAAFLLSLNRATLADEIVAIGSSDLAASTQAVTQSRQTNDNLAIENWKKSVVRIIENRVFSSSAAVNPEDKPLVCKLYFDEDGEISCVQVKKSVGDRPFEDNVVSHLVGTKLEKPPTPSSAILASFYAPHTVRILSEK